MLGYLYACDVSYLIVVCEILICLVVMILICLCFVMLLMMCDDEFVVCCYWASCYVMHIFVV